MAAPLTHRGPDASGNWVASGDGAAMSHRRLAVIDTSPTGAQPMTSADGRYTICFNGEIYNYRDLRTRLLNGGVGLKGGSDTETLLETIAHRGLSSALAEANGMFAFAVWDSQERKLFLARDRLGQKPLYYGWAAGTFVFGSQLAALRAHPAFDSSTDRTALASYLQYGMVPAPRSIHPGAWKLDAGHMLAITPGDVRAGQLPKSTAYWSARQVARQGLDTPWTDSAEAAVDRLDELLTDAVGQAMVSDVPIGAFLSGGIDSSTVVALMQKQSTCPVRTFSIGFDAAGYDEAKYAARVAQHLGTEHTEAYMTAADAQAAIPDLPGIYDEPFADPSQLPTYLVSRLARRDVTVALSGDGGDETFAGYNRYTWPERIMNVSRRLPGPAQRAVRYGATALSPGAYNRLFDRFGPMLPKPFRQAQAGEKLAKIADLLGCADEDEMYRTLISFWRTPASALADAGDAAALEPDAAPALPGASSAERYMLRDTLCYLPDDILVKLDRAAMALSLETRAPLLDHRVVEFGWSLPMAIKMRDGRGKWPLRALLARHLPAELIDRPKMGFAVPIDTWLRGDLRAWADGLLDADRLRAGGLFDADTVHAVWQEHLSGQRNHQYRLWPVLMFEAWRDRMATAPVTAAA
jgi:asparagine synthase (glutamine-hydrolysing)